MKRQFQAFAYKVVNQSEDTLDVFIDGIIVDADTQQILKDWFGDETSVSYKSFRDQVLNAKPKILNIYINSGGGMVTDAMAIHDFLIDQENKGITVNRTGRGIIASAATYLLIGNNSSMSENSMFMIHNVSGGAYGDVNMLENYAASMRKFNDNIVNFYSKATGLSETVVSNMMDKETWMTASEAKDKGFVKNVTGKVDFTNAIKPENWPFENTAILNDYNSAVKVPSNKEEDSHKSFFTTLQNGFMKLIDSLTNSTENGKKDKQFENVENRDAILDMVNKVLAPVMKNIDDELAKLMNQADEGNKETTTETKPAETKPEETKPAEEKKDDKKEAATEETDELKNIKAEIANMKNENQQLRDSLAAKFSKPDNEKDGKKSKGFNTAKVEYV